MNNSNPFGPQVSLMEQKNKKRARVKVAVYSILAFNVLLISPLLIQGCKEKQQATQADASAAQTNDTAAAAADTNAPTQAATTPAAAAPALTNPVVPPAAPPPVAVVPPPAPAAADYVIVKGDTLSKIAHDHGTTVKALQDANPGLDPAKLQIGKKLQLPAPTAAVAATGGSTPAAADGADVYVVKAGDSLFKIAHDHSITIKALRAANDLKTDKIKVGQKLKLPAATTTAAAVAPAAPADAAPAPSAATSAVTTAVPAPTAGTAH